MGFTSGFSCYTSEEKNRFWGKRAQTGSSIQGTSTLDSLSRCAPVIWQLFYWLVFEITLSLAALCGIQGLSSRLVCPNEAGGPTSWDRHALPCPHMCQTSAPSGSSSQASLGTELMLSGKEGAAVVGQNIL